ELVRGGVMLLLTTQYLDEADELADRIAVIDTGRVIAEGTAEELKSRHGGDVTEVRLARRDQMPRTEEALRPIGSGPLQGDAQLCIVRLPVADGSRSLMAAVRRLDEAGVQIADIALRRPSLDDVFLALTGHAAEAEEEAPATGTRRRSA